jgi:hypothetical protein
MAATRPAQSTVGHGAAPASRTPAARSQAASLRLPAVRRQVSPPV